MSNRSRGMAIERKAQLELIKEGYLVQRAPPSYRWNRQTDLLGYFDLMAFIKGVAYPESKPTNVYNACKTRLIQIKMNRLPDKKWIENATKLRDTYFITGFFNRTSVEWWTWWSRGKRKNKKGWEKVIL